VPKYGKFTTHTSYALAGLGFGAAGVERVAPFLA